MSIVHLESGARAIGESLPACLNALRRHVYANQGVAKLKEKLGPTSESRSDLKDRRRRKESLNARVDTAIPLPPGTSPWLRPGIAGVAPVVILVPPVEVLLDAWHAVPPTRWRGFTADRLPSVSR